MSDFKIKLGRKTFRGFSSKANLVVYLVDISIKALVISLMAFAGISQIFFEDIGVELSRYALVYFTGIVLWALILIRYIITRGKGFGKTFFDLNFMLLLTVVLVSILFSQDKTTGVFGKSFLWSISLLTLLSIGIIYYAIQQIFKYPRGLKWLMVSIVLSLFIPGAYTLFKIVGYDEEGTLFPMTDLAIYSIYTIPLLVALVFVFKKFVLKIITVAALISNLIIVSYYYENIDGNVFMLGCSALLLFCLFYFSLWVKNSQDISKMFVNFVKFLKREIPYGKFIEDEKRNLVLMFLLVFAALWIIVFSYMSWNYYQDNIRFAFIDSLKEELDLSRLGKSDALFGDGDFSFVRTHFEFVNIIFNYGFIGLAVFIFLYERLIAKTVSLGLRFMKMNSWSGLILASAIFLSTVSIVLNSILSRISPMMYVLLVFSLSSVAIMDDIMKKNELYELPAKLPKMENTKRKLLMIASILAIVLAASYAIKSIGWGLGNELFTQL